MSDPQIKIPKIDIKEVVIIPGGYIGFQKEVNKRFEKIDTILFGVIAAVVVSLVAVVIAVIGIFLDQMRYNNAAYKQYSGDLKSIETMQKSNDILLEENKHNQQTIIDQQSQLKELLKK